MDDYPSLRSGFFLDSDVYTESICCVDWGQPVKGRLSGVEPKSQVQEEVCVHVQDDKKRRTLLQLSWRLLATSTRLC